MLKPVPLPDTDPSNILPNGQPKFNEDAWAVLEQMRAGDFLYLVGSLPKLGAPTPKNFHELVERLVTMIDEAKAFTPADPTKWPGKTDTTGHALDAVVKMLAAAGSQPYAAKNPLVWSGRKVPATLAEAIEATAGMPKNAASVAFTPANPVNWPNAQVGRVNLALDHLVAQASALESGAGVTAGNFASEPTSLVDAVNRIADAVKTLRGSSIP